MKARDIPNLISAFRIVLVIPVIYMLLQQQFLYALILFAIAGISDAVDGYIARRFNWMTRLGGILDPLADKLLQVCCYITLAFIALIPVWLVIVVVLRDVIIVAGGMLYHYRFERFHAEPMLISKINTFMQIMLVILVVFNAAFNALPEAVLDILILSVLMTTVISGVSYIVIWGRRAWAIHQQRKGQSL